jgi:predicted nucleotidyltransferase
MVDPHDILKFTDEVARRFKPDKIILFGSYAYGTPTQDSDVDLLVVKPYRGASCREAIRIDAAIDRPFPLDLIVRSPMELTRRLAMNDGFLRQLVEHGMVLYDRDNQRTGRQGRRRLQHRIGHETVASSRAL